METTVFEIEFNDGRLFRIFCANSSQKKRCLQTYNRLKETCTIKVITNGIHTIKEFEKLMLS